MLLSPALQTERQVDLCECRDSLVYRANFKAARATKRNPVPSQTKSTNQTEKKPKQCQQQKQTNKQVFMREQKRGRNSLWKELRKRTEGSILSFK